MTGRNFQSSGRSLVLFGFVLLLSFAVCGGSAFAQDTVHVDSAGIVLPANGFLPGWVKSEPVRRFTGKNLYGYINGGAELFLEFGFSELLVQKYVDQGHELSLEAYMMNSPPAALGIYLLRCGEETPVTGIAGRNSGDRYQFTILRGNCLLLVNNFDGDSALLPAMTILAQRTLSSIPEGAPITLFEHLPAQNLIAGSARLLRGPYGLQPIFTFGKGDVLQLGGETYALVGEYAAANDQTYTQIIIPYATAPAAAQAYAYLLTHLDPYLTVLERTENSFTFKDFQQKFGIVRQKDRMMFVKVGLAQMPVLE